MDVNYKNELKKYCKCSPGSIWFEKPRGSTHRFKVVCEHCGKHIKWGANQELEERKLRDASLVIQYCGVQGEREVIFRNGKAVKRDPYPWE